MKHETINTKIHTHKNKLYTPRSNPTHVVGKSRKRVRKPVCRRPSHHVPPPASGPSRVPHRIGKVERHASSATKWRRRRGGISTVSPPGAVRGADPGGGVFCFGALLFLLNTSFSVWPYKGGVGEAEGGRGGRGCHKHSIMSECRHDWRGRGSTVGVATGPVVARADPETSFLPIQQ